jgi:biopolymer transport protein TolR
LAANEKLKRDGEMYLRADESLPYGLTLKVMAKVRAAGVGKFGLVAEPEG